MENWQNQKFEIKMGIEIVRQKISREQLVHIAKEYYDDLIKGVVDIQRKVVALGGEMHADSEEVLLEDGSIQSDLWGFNILLDKNKEECLLYESFINIRPRNSNRGLEVEDAEIREKMKEIIFERIEL